VAVNLLRGAALAGLAVAVWGGAVSVPVVYAALFLLGVGGTLADNASFALLPAIVPADRLARANARLMAGYLVANQLAGGPLGAWLFVVAAALPFGFDAASFVVGAGLIAEGVRWLWRQRTLRLLAVCLGLMNLTGAGTFAIWVLWARERLGCGASASASWSPPTRPAARSAPRSPAAWRPGSAPPCCCAPAWSSRRCASCRWR
jgi:hypothetical protein